ncbi:PAS domain S-box protein [Rubrobacter marinus]|uniref:PAS domain S-box protein n=1 Tax=Rubrobacter marinus TaxID=2653852 RepID=A0A6G8Q1W2_9ACTN|nr:PAS domain S-box protein [Rubrobacter marinus]QIN80400.1 PAS domain S-box protein [Rubrobacter marinus]
MLNGMTIGRKLGLGFALLLLLFLVSGVIIDRVVRDVSDRLAHLRAVEEPTSEAAYEMEINSIGSGLSVLKYLETQDPVFRGEAREDQGDFERNKALYDDRAESREAREAGRRLGELFDDHRELGDELMDLKDEQEELFVRINGDFRRMDGIFDEKIQADLDRDGAAGAAKAELVSEMETDAAETGTAFGAYLREPVDTNRDRIFDETDDFRNTVQGLRELDLEEREQYWIGQLTTQFEETAGRIDEAVSIDDKLREDAERFTLLREEMDEVLDGELQVAARRDLEGVEAAAVETVGDVRAALLGLLLVGLLIGSGAAAISRNIGASVRRLVEGAQQIGAGALDHRIAAESRDELGELALALNEMAEKRQRAEEEVRRLNAELEARVEERTDELTRVIANLGKSEERYRAVVEQTAECLFLFDASTKRILETNAAFRMLFGYAAEELGEMTIYDIVEDDPTSIDAHVRRSERGRHDLGERRYRRKDGSMVDVEVSGSVISYEDHDNVVLGIARDITERKEAEAELRAAEARYRTLVEQVPAALYTADFGDPPALTYASPRYEELSGYGLEDHLAEPALWSRTIHPEDREWVLDEIRQVNLSGDPSRSSTA